MPRIGHNEVALRTFRFNHPELDAGDVLEMDIAKLEASAVASRVGGTLDVLAGAPPCQGYSSVGFRSRKSALSMKRGSHLDDRNYLFEHMMRLARELRPRVVLLENVLGMDSAREQSRTYTELAVSRLQELGYEATFWKTDAAAFGVPQERQRVFIIGSRLGGLPSKPSGQWKSAHRRVGPRCHRGRRRAGGHCRSSSGGRGGGVSIFASRRGRLPGSATPPRPIRAS